MRQSAGAGFLHVMRRDDLNPERGLVHHGNGTQMAFCDNPDVLTISLHQDGYYPVDSGKLDEIGEGAGDGPTSTCRCRPEAATAPIRPRSSVS